MSKHSSSETDNKSFLNKRKLLTVCWYDRKKLSNIKKSISAYHTAPELVTCSPYMLR